MIYGLSAGLVYMMICFFEAMPLIKEKQMKKLIFYTTFMIICLIYSEIIISVRDLPSIAYLIRLVFPPV